MKFTHKIAKLAQPLTYRRAWRRAERHIHPVPLEPIYARIDQPKLAAIQAQYASSKEHYAKYADIRRWLRLNIVRAQDLKLHRCGPKSVLDLGYRCQIWAAGPVSSPRFRSISTGLAKTTGGGARRSGRSFLTT